MCAVSGQAYVGRLLRPAHKAFSVDSVEFAEAGPIYARLLHPVLFSSVGTSAM